jgi:hypothetical protein
MIDDAGIPGGRGGVNRLSSGVGVGAVGAFGDLIVRRASFLALNALKRLPFRKRNRNMQKANSSAWHVCRAINYSISYFHFSAIRRGGAYGRYGNARSSQKFI